MLGLSLSVGDLVEVVNEFGDSLWLKVLPCAVRSGQVRLGFAEPNGTRNFTIHRRRPDDEPEGMARRA